VSAVKTHPVLAELETRAGASDQDRPAWLAERRRGVTATEIRDLVLKGPGYRADLIKEKVAAAQFVNAQTTDDTAEFKPGKGFVANRYTAWGNTREPIIAEWVERRFTIRNESRVFHAVDNPRFLASPDGVGVGFDDELVVAEIKTSKDDIAPSAPAFKAKGYNIQMLWVMRVTGARRCRYVWEQHDSDWQDRGGQFEEPAPLYAEPLTEWFDYDETAGALLEEVAVDFLAELDKALRDAADGTEAGVDEYLDTLAVNVLTFREQESSAKAAKEKAWDELLNILETDQPYSQESILARVTYSPGQASTSEVLDAEAAKAADPELFAEVQSLSKRWNEHAAKFKKTVELTSKPRLTVTSVKQTKEKKK